jgi:hypothetical protein
MHRSNKQGTVTVRYPTQQRQRTSPVVVFKRCMVREPDARASPSVRSEKAWSRTKGTLNRELMYGV